MILSNLPSESCHYYYKDGSPAYTIVGKNGKERPPTIREVKSLGLFPSVTQVLKIRANPGLDQWKRKNLLLAAATLPHLDGESADDWCKRVEQDAGEQSRKAIQLGVDIHKALEHAYGNALFDLTYLPHVEFTQKAIFDTFGEQEWKAEKSFAAESRFYGGKTDLHSPDVMIDFKTTAFDEAKWDRKEVGGYKTDLMQISAYREELCSPNARGANVYVSTTVPGLVRIKEWTQEELEYGFRLFCRYLEAWREENKV
jgi:hypothetical protein